MTACNSFEGIYEYIIFFVYLDDLRAVVRNTSNTTTPNTISLSCSLVDFPNWLSLEITPPLTFHKQRWCETRYLGIRSIFAFFFFHLGWGEILEKGCLQDHQVDNLYRPWGGSSQTELIQDYPCVSYAAEEVYL